MSSDAPRDWPSFGTLKHIGRTAPLTNVRTKVSRIVIFFQH